MMRMIQKYLPLVLMGSAILAAQQGQSTAPPKPAQAGAAKQAGSQNAPKTATRRSSMHHASKTVAHKARKRPEYRAAYSESSVEVINGDATKKVVFQDDQAAALAKKGSASLKSSSENAPGPMKVEVVNGAYTDTQYLYNNGEDQLIEASLNRPVVIGVQSSDTRNAGGNKNPVVTRVTASGAGDARSASEGGQPVTKQVSPRQRRPVYQPDQQ
jgi:hypothetical protein